MIEQIIIVNNNDNIIWYKERWTLEFPEDIYRISSLRLKLKMRSSYSTKIICQKKSRMSMVTSHNMN